MCTRITRYQISEAEHQNSDLKRLITTCLKQTEYILRMRDVFRLLLNLTSATTLYRLDFIVKSTILTLQMILYLLSRTTDNYYPISCTNNPTEKISKNYKQINALTKLTISVYKVYDR